MEKRNVKYYTGVDSRQTPKEVLELMTKIAVYLDKEGYILRSGGADGADKAFEKGSTHREIYKANDATIEAMEMAAKYHGNWFACSPYAKKLHGRNVFQVLGRDLKTPSEFVVCWTQDGCEKHEDRSFITGGTGTAISVASEHGITVWNLAKGNNLRHWKERINEKRL